MILCSTIKIIVLIYNMLVKMVAKAFTVEDVLS